MCTRLSKLSAPPATDELQTVWQQTYAGLSCREDAERKLVLPSLGSLPVGGRPWSDCLAAWLRWYFDPAPLGFNPSESYWYALFERARVEELASRDLPGIAWNLREPNRLAPEGAAQAMVYCLAREALARTDRDDETQGRSGPSRWSGSLPSATEPERQQDRQIWQRWLQRLRGRARPQSPSGPSPVEIRNLLLQARPLLDDGLAFASLLHPMIQELARSRPVPAASADKRFPKEMEAGEDIASMEYAGGERPYPGDDASADLLTEMAGGQQASSPIESASPTYRHYCTQWDEEVPARAFCTPEDRLALAKLDADDRQKARRLAMRLQWRLLIARHRHWQFDQEFGQLDSRRLARLLNPAGPMAVFRQEGEAAVPEACVTLLVDQSGSMRGRPQRLAVQALDFAVQVLEACRISCEVLGYTTPYGADNPVARLWQSRGSPSSPGRLNATRHLIYKTARQPWRGSRNALGLMLRDGFGRENFDGEALDWAARRLLSRPERRKILIVLSDGAPYDAATVATQGKAYLDAHLHAVITRIEAAGIHVSAIGAGVRVSRFYRTSLNLQRPEAVAETLFNQLGDLLTKSGPGASAA